jgi:hypothetical protein
VSDAADWLGNALSGVFGGWSNVMQGFGGALVAVLGAFYVARWTVHNELKRQDERTRDAMGAEAASQILTAVATLPEALRRLEDLEPDMNGIGYRHVTEWETNQTELLTQLRLHGMLLPATIETQAVTLAGLLGRNLFDIDVDEESNTLIWLDDNHDRVQAAIRLAEATMQSLQDYRRDPASAPRT